VIERVTQQMLGGQLLLGQLPSGKAHVEIYEEKADIHKEAFVREEVKVTKVVEQETVEAQETLRREELDVDSGSTPIVDTSERLPKDRTTFLTRGGGGR